jgi:hypothetical protein
LQYVIVFEVVLIAELAGNFLHNKSITGTFPERQALKTGF